jgi:hypothetical protein
LGLNKFNAKAQGIECDGKLGIEKKSYPFQLPWKWEKNQNLLSYGRCGKVLEWIRLFYVSFDKVGKATIV